MSSKSTRDIPIGWATLFAGIAAIIAALIGVYFGRNNPTTTSTRTPQATSVITATADPRQTPYVVVATRGPLIITATATADEQDPPPGSIVPFGTAFERSGLVVKSDPRLEGADTQFCFRGLTIENHTEQNYVLRYTLNQFHLHDETGRQYFPEEVDLQIVEQITIRPGGASSQVGNRSYDYWLCFQGTIPIGTKYFVLTVDQLAGMKNLNWRYEFQ